MSEEEESDQYQDVGWDLRRQAVEAAVAAQAQAGDDGNAVDFAAVPALGGADLETAVTKLIADDELVLRVFHEGQSFGSTAASGSADKGSQNFLSFCPLLHIVQ